MPYRPADFSGLMKDYAVGMQMRYTYDTHARELEINNAERAMTGLSYIEGLYVDEKAKWEEKHGSVDIEKFDDYFAEKYPAVRDKLKGYFNDYAAQEWADNGETDPDHPVEIIKSGFKKGMYMLLGRNAKGEPVPKTENGSSDGKDPIIELSAEQLLKNTRYNIALKYGINPVTAGQMATGLAGGTIYGGGSLAGTQQPSAETTSEADSAPLGTTTPSTATPGSAPVAGEPDVTTPAGSDSLAAGASSVPAYLADGRSIEQAEISANQTPTKTAMSADGTVEPLRTKAVNAEATTPAATPDAQPIKTVTAGSGAPDMVPNPSYQAAMDARKPVARGALSREARGAMAQLPGYSGAIDHEAAKRPPPPKQLVATPEQVDEAWAEDIEKDDEAIAREKILGQQALEAGDQAVHAKSVARVSAREKEREHKRSAKERGLSRDEFEKEKVLIKAVEKGLLEKKKNAYKKAKENTTRPTRPERAEPVTPESAEKIADDVRGEAVDLTGAAKDNATSGNNKKNAQENTAVIAAAAGPIGVLKTIAEVDKESGISHAGTKASNLSPAKRLAFATLAMQGGFLPRDEAGLVGMTTFIQTGRFPTDVANHYKNQLSYMQAASSYYEAQYKIGKNAREERLLPYQIQEASAKAYASQAAARSSLETARGTRSDRLRNEDLHSLNVEQAQADVAKTKAETAANAAQAQAEKAAGANEQRTQMQEEERLRIEAINKSVERATDKFRGLTKVRALSVDPIDIDMDDVNIDRVKSSVNGVLDDINFQKALVIAAFELEKNNEQLTRVANKIKKGEQLQDIDLSELRTFASQYENSVVELLTLNAVVIQDRHMFDEQTVNGRTDLQWLVRMGKDGIQGSGDRSGYGKVMWAWAEQSGMGRERAEAFRKALRLALQRQYERSSAKQTGTGPSG